MSESAARQRVLAAMLLDPAFEARVRNEPESIAREHQVSEAFVRALAAMSEARVREFRLSQRHKDQVREGKGPSKLRW